MSARKQRRVGDSNQAQEPEPEDSDSESSGDTAKGSSFKRKSSNILSDMNLHRSHSDCDLTRTSVKIVKPKQQVQTTHRIVADLGCLLPYVGGILQKTQFTEYTRPNALTGRKLVVNCPCGDTWENKYPDVIDGRPFRTEHKRTDITIKHFEAHGHVIQDQLHKGKYGVVLLAYSKNNARHEVIKITHTEKLKADDPDIFTRTQNIHQNLHHPCVVQLLSYTTVRGTFCFILEWCENGSLEQLLRHSPGNLLPEPIARKYYQDLISGIEYIHRQCIVHLNLNARSLLINYAGRLKITDFSRACRYATGDDFPNGHRINFFGHLPPEVFSSATMLPKFNPRKADIWASGVVLFQSVCGKLPFGEDKTEAIALNVSERRGIRPAYCLTAIRFTHHLRDLLNHVLTPLPEARATIPFIQSHPFYNKRMKRPYIGNLRMVSTVGKKAIGPVMEQLLQDHGI